MLNDSEAFKFSTHLMEQADAKIRQMIYLPPKLYQYMDRNHFVSLYWDGDIYVDPRYWENCSNRKKVRVILHDLEHLRQVGEYALWQWRYRYHRRSRVEFEIDAMRISIYARLAFGKTHGIDKALRRLKRYGANEMQLSTASLQYALALTKDQRGANPVKEVIEQWKNTIHTIEK